MQIAGTSLATSGGSPTIIFIEFQQFSNHNGGTPPRTMQWLGVPVAADGRFLSTTRGDIDGAFYGTGHTEVSGTFNRGGVIGAFGGTRQ